MSTTQQTIGNAEKWERQARRNKPLAYIFLFAGTIAFLMGWNSNSVPVMLAGIWLHICGDATFLMVGGLERSSCILRAIQSRSGV